MEKIAAASLHALPATERTVWLFLTLAGDSGAVGFGEATLNGQEAAVAAAFARIADGLIGKPAEETALADRLPFGSLSEAAASSAALQATADLAARAEGRSLADALGGARRTTVPLYANINRRTVDRSPDGFRASADAAHRAGYTAFKIAPFDGLEPGMGQEARTPLLAAAYDRIGAVRDVVGPTARLMVDCHWRFDETTSLAVLDELKAFDLYWFECPIPQEAAETQALKRIRARANGMGVRLAGAEKGIRLAGFRPFLDAGAYDAMMPDVKYAGGPSEMLRIADAFAAAGVDFSPHNPSGPICHAISAQICAAVEGADLLECQFDEAPAFDAVQAPAPIRQADGAAVLPAGRPGAGVDLRQEMLTTVTPSAIAAASG